MTFDLQRILESKAAHRRKLADLPVGEKLRLLNEMRERALTIQVALRSKNPSCEKNPLPIARFPASVNLEKAHGPAYHH